jgi:DNA-binding winged helix-turn-helix (wHTH) protein/predicted ATPase
MIYAFGAYTLDTDRYELRRAGLVCPLEPHALDILAYLLQHRDRVVTKHELLERLWPNRFVGEGILAQRLMMIRKAIGDSGSSQHCIKTLHGRGYRFAAEVAEHASALLFGDSPPTAGTAEPSDHADALSSSVPASRLATPLADSQGLEFPETIAQQAAPRAGPTPLFRRPPYFVGRDAELAQLARWWSTAQQGMRQVGFVAGEPGIGKTALVDAFVAQVAATRELSVGCGQWVDDYGMGEPYLPLLEALGRLCRDPEGDCFVSGLRRYAPSWLAHLPSVRGPADRESLVRITQGVTPTQMLRELTDALEAITAARPLILVLEDLHWSDRATLAWLAYMARKRDSAHVLILGTYRPDEVLACVHPLPSLLTELRAHAQCVELVLEPLSAPAVAAYLSERCSATLPATLPQLIHRRTGGHPLFLVAMADELVHKKLFETEGEARGILENRAALGDIVPTNLRQYIEQQFGRLSDEDQALIESASIAGSTFTVAAVTKPGAQSTHKVEARYTALARQGRFIQPNGIETWPDGTMTSCYQFKHALYHDVVYERVSAERRMHLHQQIGGRKERGYGKHAQQIAAELADHFARGRDAGRAVHYLHHAADNALQRSAYQEAITHLTQGLELLASLPEAAERTQHELRFLTKLGLALVATKGQAHGDVGLTFARARTLCHQPADSPQLFLALVGLFSCHVVRSELQAAGDVAKQLSTLAERESDTTLRLVAQWALGQTLLFQGQVVPARVHLEQGIALYQPKEHHALRLRAGFPGDLGVFCRCSAAHALWHLGYPDEALHHIQHALTLSGELAHPYSRALALAYAAMLHQFRRETHLAQGMAETAIALCQEQGFAYYLAWGILMRGWALSAQCRGEEGMAEMRRGLDAIRATGAQLRQPYYLALLAEACGQTGEVEGGMQVLAEALAEADHHGEGWQEAELHRLRGELLLLAVRDPQASRSHPGGCQIIDSEAEQCFHQALAIATRQQAKSLELRAATSLARLWQRKGSRAKAYDLLAPIYHWFTEGFDTADLRDAKALLRELG